MSDERAETLVRWLNWPLRPIDTAYSPARPSTHPEVLGPCSLNWEEARELQFRRCRNIGCPYRSSPRHRRLAGSEIRRQCSCPGGCWDRQRTEWLQKKKEARERYVRRRLGRCRSWSVKADCR